MSHSDRKVCREYLYIDEYIAIISQGFKHDRHFGSRVNDPQDIQHGSRQLVKLCRPSC